jgi:hypothetical protein
VTSTYSIDIFALFLDRLWIQGWIFDSDTVVRVGLELRGIKGGLHSFSSFGLSSPAECDISSAVLVVLLKSGRVTGVGNLAVPQDQ